MNNCCTSANCLNFGAGGVTDQSVVYTGTSVPAFNICYGDSLNNVEAAVLQVLTNFSTGVGISMPNINLTTGSCAPLFAGCISCCGSCTDLPCLLNCYHTAICTLYTDVTTLQTEVTALLSGPYNTACLTGVTSSSPLNAIIQEMILELCTAESDISTLTTSITNINNNLNTNIGNFLLNAITSCTGTDSVIKTGTGATASIAFKGFTPIGGFVGYVGVTAGKFDSTGLGLAGTDMCGWAIMNGNNGTTNMMGQIGVGLTNMGGTLPSNATGMSVTTIGQQIGEPTHTLTINEIPSVPIYGTIILSTLIGVVTCNISSSRPGDNSTLCPQVQPGTPHAPANQSGSFYSNYASVDIPISFGGGSGTIQGNTGGKGLSHNNIQPSTGVVYIQRIS